MSATFFAGHDGLLCDLDGVVYAGGGAIAGAVETLSTLQERGVPVGFVNVVESKELFLDSPVPHIIARGRKGGSNVAAAICNALLYQILR